MEIIVTHVNVDFDALAATVATKKIYPQAGIILPGSQNKNVREFLNLHGDVFKFLDLKRIIRKAVKRIIVVDTRIAGRLGEAENLIYQPQVEIFTFDHHPPTSEDIVGAKDFSEITGAVTTTLVKIIRDRKIEISPFEATLFALGIHEDTGSLTYPMTTYDDVEVLAYLMSKKANVNVINHFLNMPLTKEQHNLLNFLLQGARKVKIQAFDILFTQAEVPEFVDGASVLTHKVGDLENADVVFTFLKTRDRIYIIARSKVSEISVSEILEKFDGGGHAQAASGVVKKNSLIDLEREIIGEIEKKLKKPLVARDIMTKPVRTISSLVSIKKANELMLSYGHSGIPVMEKKKLIGIISRRDVDKAIFHNLSHAPVKGFMSRDVVTVSPDIPLHDIQKLLVEKNIGRLPVIENGKVVGIVTRSDVLRALHGLDYLGKGAEVEKSKLTRRAVIKKMEALFPAQVIKLIKELGQLAESLKVNVYLVGGIVRDLLLNWQNLDVDLVIEGNGISFAKKVATKFGARVNIHKKFGTAVVIFPDHFRVDIASARTEFYEQPAALPQVRFSSVREDLARRDFTINTMAIALNTSRMGEILDFFGGFKDLEEKKIRVLHNLSFIEDPTRIFRAVRFEQRYGFKIEPQTENLAKKAVKMELVFKIMGERLREELIYILSEKTAYEALERLRQLGALKFIHPKIKLNSLLKRDFNAIIEANEEVIHFFHSKPKRWLVFLILLFQHLSTQEIKKWAKEVKLRKKERETLIEGVRLVPKVSKRLEEDLKDSQIFFGLKPLSPETLLYLYAQDKEGIREKILRYLSFLRNVNLSINGNDLLKLGFKPSPEIGKALKQILVAKLDGKIKTKKEEIELAKKILRKAEEKKDCIT